MTVYTIYGKNVPSSKNSKRIVRNRLINSKLALEYYDFVLPILEDYKEEILKELETKTPPYKFHFYYFRKDKRHWDFINMVLILADAFLKVGILEDDDVEHFIPYYDGYEIDKDNPGVEFYIE